MLVEFLHTVVGATLVECLAILVVLGLLIWARAEDRPDRRLVLGAAAILTIPVGIVYVLAVATGSWTGAYFRLAPVVQAAIVLPLSMLGWTLWLAGYEWLADRSHQPVQIYIAISLLLIWAVALAHRLNLGKGLILVGPDLTIVVVAAVGQLVLWIPLVVYEALRRNIERFDPIP